MKCPQDLHDLNRLQYVLCTFVCDHRRNKRFAVYVHLYRLTVWIQKVGYCKIIVSLFWCIDISSVYKLTFRKRFGHHKRYKYDIRGILLVRRYDLLALLLLPLNICTFLLPRNTSSGFNVFLIGLILSDIKRIHVLVNQKRIKNNSCRLILYVRFHFTWSLTTQQSL